MNTEMDVSKFMFHYFSLSKSTSVFEITVDIQQLFVSVRIT
jgi:hypothetical protein